MKLRQHRVLPRGVQRWPQTDVWVRGNMGIKLGRQGCCFWGGYCTFRNCHFEPFRWQWCHLTRLPNRTFSFKCFPNADVSVDNITLLLAECGATLKERKEKRKERKEEKKKRKKKERKSE